MRISSLEFFRDKCSHSSGIETDEGTPAIWADLEHNGYVTKMKYGGMMGHRFSYDITDKGKKVLKDLNAKTVDVHLP